MTRHQPPSPPPATTAALPLTPPDFATAWQAILARDPGSDGRFVFAVVTTGVYCRPSCPARRPLRRNVRCFADPPAAEAAGFRACLRCRPGEERPDAARRLAEAAREILERHLDERVTLARLAAETGVTPWHLQRTFKRVFGQSPQSYVNARRIERVKRALREERDVTTAVFEAGFGAASQLYAQASAKLGMTPGAWRRGGRGARVRFATAASPLGRVLVAATERGVCAVLLGADDAEVEAALRRELPEAEIERGGADLRSWVREVLRRVAGRPPRRELPLDTPASELQRRVWEALGEIPRGETRTYGAVAAGIGRPRAARAVAAACAANRLAVVVPCHRVLPAAGGVGGYRWGAGRKSALLAAEEPATRPAAGVTASARRAGG